MLEMSFPCTTGKDKRITYYRTIKEIITDDLIPLSDDGFSVHFGFLDIVRIFDVLIDCEVELTVQEVLHRFIIYVIYIIKKNPRISFNDLVTSIIMVSNDFNS